MAQAKLCLITRATLPKRLSFTPSTFCFVFCFFRSLASLLLCAPRSAPRMSKCKAATHATTNRVAGYRPGSHDCCSRQTKPVTPSRCHGPSWRAGVLSHTDFACSRLSILSHTVWRWTPRSRPVAVHGLGYYRHTTEQRHVESKHSHGPDLIAGSVRAVSSRSTDRRTSSTPTAPISPTAWTTPGPVARYRRCCPCVRSPLTSWPVSVWIVNS